MWHIKFIGLSRIANSPEQYLDCIEEEAGMKNMDKWLNEMVDKGLASTTCSWIERAVHQKHPKLTLDLAYSILFTYSDLDKVMLQRQILN